MEATTKKTMPFKYFVMYAAIWFLASCALGLSQVEGERVVYVQAALLTTAILLQLVAAILQSGWKQALIALAILIVGIAVVYFLLRDRHRPLASAMDNLALTFSMFFALAVVIQAWGHGGVEWHILKDSALPALMVILAFSYFYIAYERKGRLDPLTSPVIWFVASTAWLGSAVITARRLL